MPVNPRGIFRGAQGPPPPPQIIGGASDGGAGRRGTTENYSAMREA